MVTWMLESHLLTVHCPSLRVADTAFLLPEKQAIHVAQAKHTRTFYVAALVHHKCCQQQNSDASPVAEAILKVKVCQHDIPLSFLLGPLII